MHVKTNKDPIDGFDAEEIVRQVNKLTDDVKLQSINLAVILAKAKQKNRNLQELDSKFGELISKVNNTSRRIKDVLMAFKGQKKMVYSLPSSSKIIAKRGAYDEIEASLGYIYNLSQGLLETINRMKHQQPLDKECR